ncbi:alpha/beta hydrolase [Glutamicibacter sp.]|uniref:alpha/beta hydrolase n=1 Tax=Glutamicibacter sp. TaxID=1931995 RepID=UPI002B478EAE|nr:alpha/beta hydrolase [Glutamicibacter sp.]HJX77206.1 alpha/beta hydrolase [Glutamicibacter sp.]
MEKYSEEKLTKASTRDDRVADTGLQQWLSTVCSAPKTATPPDLESLRLPRTRCPGPDLYSVRNFEIPSQTGVPVRYYQTGEQPRPLVVYVHGGAFTFGDLESHDRTCRRLALHGDVNVMAVDFRLAPEHPAPAAIEDVVNVLRWASIEQEQIKRPPMPVALAGDSSGGLIAVLSANEYISSGGLISAMLLACPNADLTLSSLSIRNKGQGWGLSSADLRWFIQQWVEDLEPETLGKYSPLHVDLKSLPTTLIAIAEHDPLHDEGAELAKKLRVLGVDVQVLDYAGLVHGFLSLDNVSTAAEVAGTNLLTLFGQVLHDGLSGALPRNMGH